MLNMNGNIERESKEIRVKLDSGEMAFRKMSARRPNNKVVAKG